MNGSGSRIFGNVLIGAGLVQSGFVLGEPRTASALVGLGLLVGGCLLRIEAAILRGQPAPEPRGHDPELAWRRPSEVLHLPERPGGARPWHEPDDQR